ncbi:MAG: riboflavin biosynthesis protein RibF [Bacilli bacterium]|jgi:riboflavin kinase/FMN adenylyltransferase|nr:riboflavin biosynthesis protein RibF [Bacilli bacterium]MCI2054790.1 riboflavin biosynthesis protein RibF [Bacilli bacterium]
MQTFRYSLGEVPPLGYKTTLCLGTFDGFHKGHQSLILEARKNGEGDVAVLLFDHSPTEFFDTGKSLDVLTSLEDKCRLFESKGVDIVYILHVDKGFFSLGKDEFIEKVLKPLSLERIVVGEDYSFGKNAEGNPTYLKKYFDVDVVPLMMIDGKKISTQSIVSFIKNGDIKDANTDLGRPYQIEGVVKHGYMNGRKIGFPTANLSLLDRYVLPKDGVYVGLAYVHGMPHPSLVNVGKNPTVGLLKESVVECYIKGIDEDLYGSLIYVEFLFRLRDEIKFASLDEVKQQIEKDLKFL